MRALLIVILLISPARADDDEPLCIGYRYDPRRLTLDEAKADLLRARAASRVARCGARNGAHGTVHVRIAIDRDGAVTRVATTASTGHEALDRCILGVVRSARFSAAEAGTSFQVKLRY